MVICKRIYVLDTSLFTNPNARKRFVNNRDDDKDTTFDAVNNFLKIVSNAKNIEFFMPLSIKKELTHFLNEEEHPLLESVIKVKNPSLHELSIPAAVFYDFIDEIRNHIDRGLRVSETVLREASSLDISIDQHIHVLREKYRKSLRDGIIDSKEDFDVLMLAKEINGIIITADVGLMKMATQLGISFIEADRFYELLIYQLSLDPATSQRNTVRTETLSVDQLTPDKFS